MTKTLEATSQLVPSLEAETRGTDEGLLTDPTSELKVRCVYDTCLVDTFFSLSVCGYLCWNLYSFMTTDLLYVIYVMHGRAQGSVYFVVDHGDQLRCAGQT